MKRFSILFLVVALVLLIAILAWAAPVTITGPDGQDQAIVEKGALRGPISKAIKSQTGTGSFYIGPCRVQRVSIYGVTAADIIGLYDYGDATHRSGSDVGVGDIRDIEFELSISANTSTAFADLGGAPFVNGIYIHTKVATTVVSVVFDY